MITIIGASGKTGLAAALSLLEKGHKVRVVGRSEEHLKSLKDKGAQLLIGDQSDADFLTKAFTGVSSAYVLIPPRMDRGDVRAYYNEMGEVIVEAIKRSKLSRIVFLSSLGAEQETETGPVLGLHDVERKLSTLKNVDIVFLRPGYFFENTLMNVGLIKHQHINVSPTEPDAPVLMIAAKDIGNTVADILAKPEFKGHSVVELFGDRLSYREATKTIGSAIGNPSLPYVKAPDNDAIDAMVSMGLARGIAESYVDLAHGISKGKVTTRTLDATKPNAPTKFVEFVKDIFVPVYNKAA